jgi:hypothetical protein
MKNKTQQRILLTPLQTGQVWQLADSHLRIGLVGRTLVHYKHCKGLVKASPVYLSSKAALQEFLERHNAVLLEAPRPRVSAAATRRKAAAKR